MSSVLKLRINDHPVEGFEGETILAVSRRNRIEIPALCISIPPDSGNPCNGCMVEIKGLARVVPACSTLISEGMEIYTHQPLAVEARKSAIDLLTKGHHTETNPGFNTICAYCSVGCLVHISIEGKSVKEVSGAEGLINSNGNICHYGKFGYHFLNDPNRITQPMLKKNGRFEPITWDEALNLLEKKLKEGKPEEKAFFAGARLTNEEMYLVQKLARAAVKTNNIGSFHYLGRGKNYTKLSRANLPFEELAEARRVYLIGSEIDRDHPVAAAHVWNNQKESGLNVGMVTTQDHSPLEEKVDNLLKIKSYYHFIKAVNYYLLSQNLENTAFIKDLIDNFEEYRTQLLQESWEDLVIASGVDRAETIIRFALDYSNKMKFAIIFSEKELSGRTCAEIFNMACITGKHGKNGSGLMLLKEKNNSHGLHDMGIMPNLGPGATDWVDPFQRSTFAFNWGVEDLPDDKGCSLNGMREGRFRQLFIFGEDPMGCANDPADIGKMLADKDFILVQDYFMTETALMADLVLPASLPFETGGTFTNTQRVIQKIDRKMQSPVGIVSWKQLDALLGRFGFSQLETADDVTLEVVSLLPKFCTSSKLRLRLTKEDNFNPMFAHGCDYLGKRFDREFEGIFLS